MLLLHLIDLCLLLLHYLGQLQLVLELLWYGAALGSAALACRLVDLEHLLLAARLIHVVQIDRASGLLLNRLEMVVGLADLISDAEMLVLSRLALIHLNGRRPGTLRLVCDLYLSLTDLNSRCSVRVLPLPVFLIVRDGRQPLTRSVLLLVALGHAHAIIVLGEHALRSVPASYCHGRVVT